MPPPTPPPYDAAGVLDLLPDGVVVADAAGAVVLLNAPAAELLETTAGDARGRPLGEVVALQDRDGRDWFEVNEPYRGLGTRSGLTEQSWFRPNGTELLVTARLVRAAAGAAVEQVVVSLRTARGRARLDRERSDLVATVAHELRSPLTGVKGFVSTLLTKWDKLHDEQKKLMLTTVHSDADRLSRLITELLDVARIDTGRLSLFPRPLDVAAASDRVLASVRVSTGRPLLLETPDDELPRVTVDPDKFEQVLTNLVENGVQHGAGRVLVHLEACEEPFPGVRMSVDDEGDGIAPEIRRRVFTKFWTHGGRAGSGLGMYIVHGLVRAHGGVVEIADAPGGGARIVVCWPTEDRRQA